MKLKTIIYFDSNKITRGICIGEKRLEFIKELETISVSGVEGFRIKTNIVQLEICIGKEDESALFSILEKWNLSTSLHDISTPMLDSICKAKCGDTGADLGYIFDGKTYRVSKFNSHFRDPKLMVYPIGEKADLRHVNIFNFDSKCEIIYLSLLNREINELW